MKNFGKTTDIRDIITVGYEDDNAVLYSKTQSLTDTQKSQARTNIGAGTSSFDGNYNNLSNKPTIPTKTSQLTNDSSFATTTQVEAKYTKPSAGIPKSDLATTIQNSLTAADNAVIYNSSQSLTDAQKVQARTNIGAGTSNFSGSYNDLSDKPSIPDSVTIVQTTGTSTISVMSQNAVTNGLNGKLSKTDNTNIEVIGTKKATTTLGGNQLYSPNGMIFGGTAAEAGLVTRGICGVTTPGTGGACAKENLYLNYDGNNNFNAARQVIINAGSTGNHLGSNMYQYAAPRGEIVKNWVEAKGYATSVKMNGNTIASSSGVVDIGNVATASDLAEKANLDGGNTFLGTQLFEDDIECGDAYVNSIYVDDVDNGNSPIFLRGQSGTSGQVLTSQGAGKTPQWTTPTKGTVTSVAVKMNGAVKGTVTTSGTIDLGTVVTYVGDKAQLSGGNDFYGYQTIGGDSTGDILICFEDAGVNNATIFGVFHNADGDDSGFIKIGDSNNNSVEVQLNDNAGNSGEVFTSQGQGSTPIWKSPTIKTATLSGTTLTLELGG